LYPRVVENLLADLIGDLVSLIQQIFFADIEE
jgi:hypothetical protein